jgi:1-acyl-sn-glycerol-3-phosphate acyltransferase
MKLYGYSAYRIFKGALSLFMHLFLRLRYSQTAPIPPGAKVYAINHPTVWDAFPFLIYGKAGFIHVMVEDQIWSYILPRIIFTIANQVKLNTLYGDPEQSVADALQVLGEWGDRGVLVSIEGGVNAHREKRRARKITIRLAMEAGVPIVPVGVWIPRRNIIEKGFRYNYQGKKYVDVSYVPRFRSVYSLVTGKPIYLDKLAGRVPTKEEYQQVADKALAEVYRLSEVARERALAPHPQKFYAKAAEHQTNPNGTDHQTGLLGTAKRFVAKLTGKQNEGLGPVG